MACCYALYGGSTISVHPCEWLPADISVHEVQSMKSMGTFICYQYYGTMCTNRYLDEFFCVSLVIRFVLDSTFTVAAL
jgi:hypothetical protein